MFIINMCLQAHFFMHVVEANKIRRINRQWILSHSNHFSNKVMYMRLKKHSETLIIAVNNLNFLI